jgi:hypothetical protein
MMIISYVHVVPCVTDYTIISKDSHSEMATNIKLCMTTIILLFACVLDAQIYVRKSSKTEYPQAQGVAKAG